MEIEKSIRTLYLLSYDIYTYLLHIYLPRGYTYIEASVVKLLRYLYPITALRSIIPRHPITLQYLHDLFSIRLLAWRY